jgi:L-lactate utilization protein LutB
MSQTLTVTIFGPCPNEKRQHASEKFVTGDKQVNKNLLKERLREIRESTSKKSEIYREQLYEVLGSMPGVTVSFAPNAAEAVKLISQYAGETRPMSVNKSSIVLNELRPVLSRTGFKLYLRYFNEFENFCETTFKPSLNDYWALPALSDKGLMGSWSVQQRFESFSSENRRDYVALLGVNAISASDASVYFLQHMSNISKDLEQARTIIFVVGIDKIVENKSAAMLHSEAMGQFGLESMLLDIIPHDIEKFDFEILPTIRSGAKPSIHFILYDNKRSNLLGGDYNDLFLCIDCRACARQCPVGKQLAHETGLLYSPKNYLFAFLQQNVQSVEGCLHCGRCQTECPLDIDIPHLFWKSQLWHYAVKGRSWKKRMLDNPEILARLGSWVAPLSGWMTRLTLARYVMQLIAGIHRHSILPAFHRTTFRRWFRSDARA